MADRSVKVTLRAEISQYKQAMGDAGKATAKVADEGAKASQQGRKFTESWSGAATPLLAVGGAITALGVSMLKTGVSYNQMQQQSRAALTTILGSAQAANAQMDKLDEFARTSPFSKQTFIQAQQQMLAFGIETQKVIPYLDAIQDAVAASGGGNEDIAGVVATMSKVQSSAKLTAEDLNELGNRGINAAELIGSQMGMTGAEIRESITAGSLDATTALDALAAGMEQRFDGAADNVKNTFSGALDRVSAAWRDLSSELAEPFVGKEGGGMFTGMLNEIADVMRAVQDLPSAAKVGIAGVTALAGAATLGAGAFLTFAPRIAATKAAVAELGPNAQRAYGATTKLAKGASIAAAGLTALSVAGGLFNDSSTEGIETWTKAILDGKDAVDAMAEGNADNWFFGMGQDGLAGSIQDAEKATGAVQKLLGVINMNPRERGANEVAAFDESLASLVRDGNLEEAARGAELFYREAERGEVSLDKAKAMLTQYRDALDGLDNDQKLAAESTAATAAEHKAAEEAYSKAREAAEGQAGAFRTLGKSLNDSKVSLGDWTKELEQQAKALENFTANARKAAKRGLDDGLVASLREAGPEGAMRLAQLAGASEKEIARANSAWRRGEAAVADYVRLVAGVPPKAGTTLTVKTVNAQAADAIRTAIQAIPKSWRSTITIETLRINRGDNKGGSGRQTFADGGMLSPRARAYADGGIDEFGRPVQRVPQIRSGSQGTVMWGEPETGWEAYVSGKPSQKPRNRAILSEAASRLGGSVEWFADGGFTEALSARELTSLRIRVRDLRRSLKETEKYGKGGKKKRLALRGLDRLEARQELAEAEAELREQYSIRRTMKRQRIGAGTYNSRMQAAADAKEGRQSTAESFANGLDSDAFRSPASLDRALTNLVRDSAEYTSLLAALAKAGASPWLLDQIRSKAEPSRGTNRTLRALLADKARLQRLNNLGGRMVSTANNYAALTSGRAFQVDSLYTGSAGFSQAQLDQITGAIEKARLVAPVTPAVAAHIYQTGSNVEVARK